MCIDVKDGIPIGLRETSLLAGIVIMMVSMVFATQHATTTTGFSFSIIHPSNADIRFIGCDNSSDGVRLLRVDGVNGSNARLVLRLGNLTANMNKTYTAAFGIVNEEVFSVGITHINVSVESGSGSYMRIWLHGNRSRRAEDDSTGVLMYNNGTVVNGSDTVAWTLNAGNNDPSDMNASGTTITTPWDETAHVRYSTSSVNATNDGRSDFVWVQVSVNIPSDMVGDSFTGVIFVHFTAAVDVVESSGCLCGPGHTDNGDGTCTATFDDPTEDGYISFDGTSFNKVGNSNTIRIGWQGKPAYTAYRGYVEWDISSIPQGSNIISVIFRYHGQSNSIDCHIHEMVGTRPSTSSEEAIFNEAGEGTVYADENGFPVVGANQQINLGSSAASDLQNQLTYGWFAIGIQSDNEYTNSLSYIYAEEYGSANPKPTLIIVYIPSC